LIVIDENAYDVESKKDEIIYSVTKRKQPVVERMISLFKSQNKVDENYWVSKKFQYHWCGIFKKVKEDDDD